MGHVHVACSSTLFVDVDEMNIPSCAMQIFNHIYEGLNTRNHTLGLILLVLQYQTDVHM